MGRYFLPIIPLFFIFLFKISKINKFILKMTILLNFLVLPIIGVSHYSSVLHMKSLYHKIQKCYMKIQMKKV